MNEKKEKILRAFLMGIAMLGLVGLGVAGSAFEGTKLAVGDLTYTVNAKEYGTQPSQETSESKEEERETESEVEAAQQRWENSTEGQAARNKDLSGLSIGTSNYLGGGTIGGGVTSIINQTSIVQQVTNTGADVHNGELPYTRTSKEIGPLAQAAMNNAAVSQGFIPGGMFDLEIGKFSTAGGFKPCDKLNGATSFDIYINQLPGYKPGVMALLSDGSTRLLNENEFDTSYSSHAFGNNTNLYVIRTTIPKAVYMTVYIPEN